MRQMLIFFLVAFSGGVFSACVLPLPDIGGADVSRPNYSGYLLGGWGTGILVRGYGNDRIQYIDVSGLREAYSAFGGDEVFDNLKPGIAMRIWYKKCLPSKTPSADYVEFFSNNPVDQPPRSYFSRR